MATLNSVLHRLASQFNASDPVHAEIDEVAPVEPVEEKPEEKGEEETTSA